MILSITLIIIVLIALLLVWLFKFKYSKIHRRLNYFVEIELRNLLEKLGYSPKHIFVVNKYLSVASNFSENKLLIIKNFNPKSQIGYSFEEISIQFIKSIEKKLNTSILTYYKNGVLHELVLTPVTFDLNEFIYNIFKKSSLAKIENYNSDCNIAFSSGSSWDCEFVWAFDKITSQIFYILHKENDVFGKIQLLNDFFTIDVKYSYFQAYLRGIPQELMFYEHDFLKKIYSELFKVIQSKTAEVVKNLIYYHPSKNILYLTNGSSSLQSVVIDKIEDNYSSQDRLHFKLKNTSQIINFVANDEMIGRFYNFVVGYNLRKLATSFDYSIDKLVNVMDNNKFIIDYTRSRFVYCSSLNSFTRFSYIVISFNNTKSVELNKHSLVPFIRLKTSDSQTIDVSCNKSEVAEYIYTLVNSVLLDR